MDDAAVCSRRSDDPVHAYKAVRVGLSPLKLWYECSAGVNGGLVCMCQGACGPACSGYLAERKTTPLAVFG